MGANIRRAIAMKFIYTVWFRNLKLPTDDQDHEWPACFVVDASGAPDAATWGDRLSSGYATRSGQQFLSSSVEVLEGAELPGKEGLPVIPYGYHATDEEIGW